MCVCAAQSQTASIWRVHSRERQYFFFLFSLTLSVSVSPTLPLSTSPSSSCCRWCGESWVMQQDQSCPSDSTSLGTSSKGRCSMATEREWEREIYSTHLKTPAPTQPIMPCSPTAYRTQHSSPTDALYWLAQIATCYPHAQLSLSQSLWSVCS